MKRALLAALLVLPAFLVAPQAVSAKPRKVKLTILGGSLTKPIEITDHHILELSDTRLPAHKPPAGLHGYEISYHFEVGKGEIRRMAVVYYYPNLSPQQGYIYSPCEGELQTIRELTTPLTAGPCGKWWYASPYWEEVIKPLIATAEALYSQN